MLTIVEKVIFLQDVDIFEYISTEDLAHIAAITEECEFTPDSIIYKEREISDSMYVVIDGSIELQRGGRELMVAQKKDAFGTWSLFDDEPRVVTAISVENSKLLKIDKEDFFDLLADNVQITQGIMKAIVKRLRSLLNRVGISPETDKTS